MDSVERLLVAAMMLMLAACGPSGPVEPLPTVTAAELAAVDPNIAELRRAGAALTTGDPDRGQRLFGQCHVCHAIDGVTRLSGPNLAGIWGRPVASQAGFGYSDALSAERFRWSTAAMDAWVAKPLRLVPGSQMSFAGLYSREDRNDLLAYMLTDPAFFPSPAH
ncbi:MAG: c-type cytochrome [Pseudomonadota bacterium]